MRIEYAGAYYHVMARGNRREAIFQDEEDRRFFLKCVAETCERTGWQIHAWVLMSNYYHLFIETPEANLLEGMAWLQNPCCRKQRTCNLLASERESRVFAGGELFRSPRAKFVTHLCHPAGSFWST